MPDAPRDLEHPDLEHLGNELDPVYIHSRRETIVLLIAFVVFLFWSVGTSYFLGYGLTEAETTQTMLGIPRWIFWGVGVPWMAANLFTFWFCMFCMANDPLGEELETETPHQAPENTGEAT